jgi:hypothetical protein
MPRFKRERSGTKLPVQRLEPADRVVVNAFADLRYLRRKQFPTTPPRALRRLERSTWDQLINYLMNLPPPS